MAEGIEFEQQLAASALGYTVNSFIKSASEDPPALKLRPAFQRNMVWNLSQRSYLVDSILRGFPVPEVYIQKRTDADGTEEIIVVDGQQRIGACVDFVRGAFRLSNDPELDPRWRSKQFDELSPDLKARFRSFEFVARQLPAVNEKALREIFRRLNRTVESLEPQELRHAAYTGPFITLVEDAAESMGLNELGIFSSRDTLRRRHDEFVAEVFYAYLLGTFPNKKDGLDEHFMVYERQGFPAELETGLNRRFGRIDKWLEFHGGTLKKTRFRNKSDAYSLIILLLKNAERLPASNFDSTDLIVSELSTFSNQVNEIKRAESRGESIDSLMRVEHGESAANYLRAVERAASDRNNRVRRDDALNRVLRPILDSLPIEPMATADEQWRELQESEIQDEIDGPAELAEAQRVLVEEA